MKLQNFNEQTKVKAEIVEDRSVGFYLYIYEESGRCIADHLQNTLALAKEQAAEDYGMSGDWQLIG